MKIIKHYADFVAKKPLVIVIAIVIFSIIMASQLPYLRFSNQDNSDMLPEGVTVIEEFDYISEEFGGTDSVSILIELDPNSKEASELYEDIRNPEIIKFTERIALAASTIQDVESTESAGTLVKKLNEGKIPATVNEIREFDNQLVGNYVNKEYSATIIRISLDDSYDPVLLYKNLKSLVENTKKPTGV
jgi:predicted RND superfamily exporter protein